jgi:hypothetical protein
MRRMFSMLVSLVLLALVVYNTAQVMSLRREVASLKKQVAAAESGHGKSSGNTSVIGKAQKHIDLAKQYALKGDFKRADKELNTGLNLLQKAGKDTTEPYTDKMENAERALNETRGVIERLWGNTGKASDKGKGG